MSSQADILGNAGSGGVARGAFGLSAGNFDVYPSKQWKAAWQRLDTYQAGGQCLIVLVGDPGTGKSTMLEYLARSLASDGKSVARLRGAQVEGLDFFLLASISLGLNLDVNDPQALEAQLREHLETESAQRELYLLVDDADMLGPSALSSLLRLANVPLLDAFRRPAPGVGAFSTREAEVSPGLGAQAETPSSPEPTVERTEASDMPRPEGLEDHSAQTGLRIVLTAPTRLLNLLGDCLVDLKNNPTVGLVTLDALEKSEIQGYLGHCLARSTETQGITVSTEAATAIHHYSRGIPRVANHIAARLLFCASESGSRGIGSDDVASVIGDLQSEGLLDIVAPIQGLGVGDERGAPAQDSHLTAVGDLVAAVEKPVAASATFNLDAEQLGESAGLPSQHHDEVVQSPQSVQSAALSRNRPWTASGPRRTRLLVASSALAIVVLTVVAGLQFWNEDSPSGRSASHLPPRSNEPVAVAGNEANISFGSALEPPVGATTPLSPQSPEFLQRLQPAAPAVDLPAASVTEIEPAPLERDEPSPSSAGSIGANPSEDRDLALLEPTATVGGDNKPGSDHSAAGEEESVLPSVAASESEQLVQLGKLDTPPSTEAPVKLASSVGEPDPVSVVPLPPAHNSEPIQLGKFDTAPLVKAPAKPAYDEEDRSAVSVTPPPSAVDVAPMRPDGLDTAQPIEAPTKPAPNTGESEAASVDALPPTDGNEPTRLGELDIPPRDQAPEKLASDVADPNAASLTSPPAADEITPMRPDGLGTAQPIEAPAAPAPNTGESEAASVDTLPPTDGDEPTRPGELYTPPRDQAPERLASDVADPNAASLTSPPAADEITPIRPDGLGTAQPIDAPAVLASDTGEPEAASVDALPPTDSDEPTRPGEVDTAALSVDAPAKPASNVTDPIAASVAPPTPADNDEVFAGVVDQDTSNAGNQNAVADGRRDQQTSDRPQIALLSRDTGTIASSTPSERMVEDPRVQELLRAAELDLQNRRLTRPQGNNAFERYQSVLEVDPENRQALKGFEDIARAYVALVGRARADGEFDRALAYLDRVETVLPEFPETEKLRGQIREDLATDAQLAEDQDQPQSSPGTGPPTLERFIILPVRTNAGCAWPFDKHMISAVRNIVQRTALERVVLSAPISTAGTGGQQASRFWSGSAPNEVPNDQEIYRYGERAGARWVLLARIDCPASATVFEPWRDFQIHLFDVGRGVSHQRAGTLGEIRSITERVLLANVVVTGG